MNGSTVVINPPDGRMSHYLTSLSRVKDLAPEKLAPGHGDLLHDPAKALDHIVTHRLEREARVATVLKSSGGGALSGLVRTIYDDVDVRMHGLAERSLLAHLIKLSEDKIAREDNGQWYPVKD